MSRVMASSRFGQQGQYIRRTVLIHSDVALLLTLKRFIVVGGRTLQEARLRWVTGFTARIPYAWLLRSAESNEYSGERKTKRIHVGQVGCPGHKRRALLGTSKRQRLQAS